MGRTNIILDDDLVVRCLRATGIKTRRALVDHALKELLRQERVRKLRSLKGTVKWEGDLKAWRRDRSFE